MGLGLLMVRRDGGAGFDSGSPVSMDFGGDRDSGCKQPVWARWIVALGYVHRSGM